MARLDWEVVRLMEAVQMGLEWGRLVSTTAISLGSETIRGCDSLDVTFLILQLLTFKRCSDNCISFHHVNGELKPLGKVKYHMHV